LDSDSFAFSPPVASASSVGVPQFAFPAPPFLFSFPLPVPDFLSKTRLSGLSVLSPPVLSAPVLSGLSDLGLSGRSVLGLSGLSDAGLSDLGLSDAGLSDLGLSGLSDLSPLPPPLGVYPSTRPSVLGRFSDLPDFTVFSSFPAGVSTLTPKRSTTGGFPEVEGALVVVGPLCFGP